MREFCCLARRDRRAYVTGVCVHHVCTLWCATVVSQFVRWICNACIIIYNHVYIANEIFLYTCEVQFREREREIGDWEDVVWLETLHRDSALSSPFLHGQQDELGLGLGGASEDGHNLLQ